VQFIKLASAKRPAGSAFPVRRHRTESRKGGQWGIFDEVCAACGKPSKPGAPRAIAAILHGYRSMILLVASWFILSKILNL